MPVTAKFAADFTDFTNAVQKAEVKLQGFDSAIGRVDRDLARFGNSFSGTKIVQEATLMTRALEQLGQEGGIAAGLAKLTATELQKVGAQAKEAAAKLTALGHDVPPNLRKIVDATSPIPEKLTLSARAADLAKSSFGQLFGAFSAVSLVQSGVSSIVSMGKAALESASRIADLSAKLGISTAAVQRMEFVAGQTGSTIEQFSSAAFKLGTRLAGGSDDVASAVRQLGIDLEKLKNIKPEERFETIIGALGKIDDATKRNELGVRLFGKTFESIAAGAAANYTELAKNANLSSDAQIQALDRAGDAVDRYLDRLSKVNVSTFGKLFLAAEGLRKLNTADLLKVLALTPGSAFVPRLEDLLPESAPDKKPAPSDPAAAGVTAPDFVARLQKAQAAVNALTKEERAQIDAAMKLGASTDALMDKYGLSEEALKVYTGAVKATTKAHDEAADAAKKSRLEHQQWLQAVNQPIFDARAKVDQFNVSSQFELQKLERTMLPGFKFDGLGFGGVSLMQRELEELQTTIIPGLKLGDAVAEAMVPPPSALSAAFGRVQRTIRTDLSGVVLQSLMGGGDVGKAVGGLVGGSFTKKFGGELDAATGLFKSGAGKFLQGALGKTIGGALGSVVPGLGTLLGSVGGQLLSKLGGALKGLFGGPSQKEIEGRSAVKQFEDQLAGILTTQQRLEAGGESWKMTTIAVRDAYLATGRSAESAGRDVKALWDSSRAGADAAREAAEKINQVLLEQQADTDRLNAAIEKYGFTLAELGPVFRNQRLSDQAKELIEDWRVLVNSGIDVTTVNGKMADAINGYLKTALQVGGEVPFAFKPILESMARQGLLVDASGNKIEDLGKAGITFSETMTQGFDRVVLKLQQLIDKLQLAGLAISDLPSDKVIDIQVRLRDEQIAALQKQLEGMSLWTRVTSGKGADIAAQIAELQAQAIPMAQGGGGLVTRPTLFLAGEAGPEEVAFSGANRSLSGGRGGDVYFTGDVHLAIGGAARTGDDAGRAFVQQFKDHLRRNAFGLRSAIRNVQPGTA